MAFGPPENEMSPLNGIDLSWLAVDRDGHVAWLVTFGSAVAPRWIERELDSFPNVEELLAQLPAIGHATGAADPGAQQWMDAAQRGLFAYDWKVHTGPYELVARPDTPITIDRLPPALAKIAARARFEHLCFSDGVTLQPADVARLSDGAS